MPFVVRRTCWQVVELQGFPTVVTLIRIDFEAALHDSLTPEQDSPRVAVPPLDVVNNVLIYLKTLGGQISVEIGDLVGDGPSDRSPEQEILFLGVAFNLPPYTLTAAAAQ